METTYLNGLIKLVLVFFLSLISISNHAYGNAPSDFVQAYFLELEGKGSLAFVSGCDGNIEDEKAVLVFVPGTKRGLIIEYIQGEVLNLAEIDFDKGSCLVSETHGGEFSYNRMVSLCKDLIKAKFTLIYPFTQSSYRSLCVDYSK